jgi:hypothetical protein
MLKIMALIPRFFNIRLFLCLFSTSKSALFRSQMPAFNVVNVCFCDAKPIVYG